MFEIIDETEDKQESIEQENHDIDQLITDAVSCATNIALHPDIGDTNATDLLCRYSLAKVSSLQLSPVLKELKAKYDQIEKELKELD